MALNSAGQTVGDLLRTLVFGPDYGLYVQHHAVILSLRSGSLEMLERSKEGFRSVDRTRTRGRSALAFAAHPTERLLAYGDNYGEFHVQRYETTGFGRARKIASKERKASRLEFIDSGRTLLIGGLGYLEAYSYDGARFVSKQALSVAVRDFICLPAIGMALINHGLHGISAYRYDGNEFSLVGSVRPGGAVDQLAVSGCGRYAAMTLQESASIQIYRLGHGRIRA